MKKEIAGYERKIYEEANNKIKKIYDELYDLMERYDEYGNIPRLDKRYGTEIIISFNFHFDDYELYGDISEDKIDIKTSSGPNVCDEKFILQLQRVYEIVKGDE